jgi:hypothetical protein
VYRYLSILLFYKTCKCCDMDKTNISHKLHNIAIDDENYQTLKTLGTVGDSFNDVVTRLIKIARRKVVQDRQDDRS